MCIRSWSIKNYYLLVRDLEGNRFLYHIVGDNEMVCKNEVKKEEHLPCIEESQLDYKYALERILKRYASAWIKLVRYDAEKEKS
jgi:hypothetical protein